MQAAIGSGFSSYYLGEVKSPPKSYLPALMIFGEETTVVAEGTLKDRFKHTLVIRAQLDVMAFVDEKGNLNAHNLILSSSTGTFVVGETIIGGTSQVNTTISTVSTGFVIVGQYGATQTFAVGETITGSTSSATGVISSVLNNSIIRSQYQLRELIEGRNSTTGMLLPNSVLGVLRNKANLRGTYYYFDTNLRVQYKALQVGEFFYVGAEVRLEAMTDLIQRPGY